VLDKAHARKERRVGRAGWQYKALIGKNWKEKLLFKLEDLAAVVPAANSMAFRFGEHYEMRLLSKSMTPEWSRLLSDTHPQLILVNVPNARGQQPVLAAARRNGISTVLLYHTWKDVSAAGRLSPVYDHLGVWNEAMGKELLRQNKWLSPEAVNVIGCTHFDCVGRTDLLLPEPKLRALIGVNRESPLLLYMASAPWLVPGEERYIRLLRRAIEEGRLPKATQIVVRTNPMDNTGSLQEALRTDQPYIVVAKPNWRWDPKINWCFQRKDDLLVYSSLLQYALACVGVPSTTTIECAIADLPVVNIGFNLPGPTPSKGSLKSFWDADFYQEVRANGAALLATNPEAMVKQIALTMKDQTIGRENRRALVSTQLGVPPHDSPDATVRLLDRSLRESTFGPSALLSKKGQGAASEGSLA
jgi:hypothetical protein